MLPPLAEELGNRALPRDVRLRIVTSLGCLALRTRTRAGRRLLSRLLGAAVDAAPDGEQVDVDVREAKKTAAISVTRPASTRQLSDAQMIDPSFQARRGGTHRGSGSASRSGWFAGSPGSPAAISRH